MKIRISRRFARTLLVTGFLLSLFACATERFEHITTPSSVEALGSGKVLAEGLAACGFCHGASSKPGSPLSGGQLYSDLYGERKVPNITPSDQAIGAWTNEQLLRYFRTGLDKDGEQLAQPPHRGLEWMADEDLFAIISYLRSVPPVQSKELHAQPLTFVDRNTSGFFEGRREVEGFVPAITKKSRLRYGQYLVEHVAACGRCHNSPNSIMESSHFLEGGALITNSAGEKRAPNITNDKKSGIGRWDEDQIVTFLQSGERANGTNVDARFCPVEFYRNAPEEDLRSIAKYLRTVAPD